MDQAFIDINTNLGSPLGAGGINAADSLDDAIQQRLDEQNEEETTEFTDPAFTTNWQTNIKTTIAGIIADMGTAQFGYTGTNFNRQFRDDWDQFLRWADPYIATQTDLNQHFSDTEQKVGGSMLEKNQGTPLNTSIEDQIDMPIISGKINPYTPQGKQTVENLALQWASDRYGLDLQAYQNAQGGRGPSGPRQPTEAELRNMFDLDKLTDQANQMGRAFLVEELPEARSIAKAYVDEWVRHRGKKEIDWQTFVKKNLKAKGRWQQIYRNKPDGQSEEQYISRYTSAAQSYLGSSDPEVFGDAVAGGAALGASAEAFAARLRNEDTVQSQAGFIGSLESRVSSISNILRG